MGGRKWFCALPVEVRCNPTTSSPPLCRLDSRRNAFCVTNSRCFPIVTLPSLSVGMCVYLRVAAGWGVGGALDLSAGWRTANGEKKGASGTGSRLSGIAVNINTGPRRYRLALPLLPTASCPVTELWQPGRGAATPGPRLPSRLTPTQSKQEHMYVRSSLLPTVSWPLSTASTPFN